MIEAGTKRKTEQGLLRTENAKTVKNSICKKGKLLHRLILNGGNLKENHQELIKNEEQGEKQLSKL